MLELLRTTEEVPGYTTVYDEETDCMCVIGLVAHKLLGLPKIDMLEHDPYFKVAEFVGLETEMALANINDSYNGSTRTYKSFQEMEPIVAALFTRQPVKNQHA